MSDDLFAGQSEPAPLQELILRPYQADGFQAIRQAIGSGIRRVMVEAPTGSGKTKVAAKIAEGARRKQRHLAFVVPAISLIDQTVEEFYKVGIRDVGVIQADHHMTDWTKPIQVCSISTIESRGAYPGADTVIFDEAHVLHAAHKKWLTHPDWLDKPMIGLSATPWAKGLGNYFQTKITLATLAELIEQKYLVPFKVFATGHPDLKSVKMVAGDYNQGQLSGVMQESSLTADIIKSYKALWNKGRTLCFAVDKAHALSLRDRFNHAGIKCGYQDGDTPADDRRVIRKMFHNGGYDVVVNIDTLTTGVDWDVRCIVLGRPTKSEMKYVQIIGRGLRLAPDGADAKDELVILDHTSTTQELGFVTDIYHDQLYRKEDKPRPAIKKRERQPFECQGCHAVYPPNVLRKCPNCGEVAKIQSGMIERDGQLVEVRRDGSMFEAAKVKAVEWTYEERRTFLAELKCYAEQQGYKPGWASMKYKEKFQEFPEADEIKAKDVAPAAEVSPTVSAWITSRRIAWVKAKQRGMRGRANV